MILFRSAKAPLRSLGEDLDVWHWEDYSCLGNAWNYSDVGRSQHGG